MENLLESGRMRLLLKENWDIKVHVLANVVWIRGSKHMDIFGDVIMLTK